MPCSAMWYNGVGASGDARSLGGDGGSPREVTSRGSFQYYYGLRHRGPTVPGKMELARSSFSGKFF